MELIDIYDELNNDLGYSVDRKKAHSDNLWHRHASTWIMNDKGEILIFINGVMKHLKSSWLN